MIKKICLIFILISLSFQGKAQSFITNYEETIFNWGGKIGLNSAIPIVNSITINGVDMENIRLHYNVGYQASVFSRINIQRFYIQPAFTWQYTQGDVRFSIPQQTETNPLPGDILNQNSGSQNKITYKAATLVVPVMIGYNLIKEGPFGLSLMAGPSFKYNYKTHYSTNLIDQARKFEDENTPFRLGLTAGVSVNIWRLFIDFNYEFGLNEVISDFHEIGNTNATDQSTLRIDKRTNLMSFSLGFFL
ncbi:MAG: porin family protein [Parabacteroides sp.]|nr:porin family protein [Parabacteroides sp.]